MPGDGPPSGPPIAGAGGGQSVFKVLGPTKIAIVALAGVLVGAAAAVIPRFLL